jgi:nitrogen fixation/metabolism regulation signal transduction histidine kinase
VATSKQEKRASSLPIAQRPAVLIPLAVAVLLLFAVVSSQTAFNIKALRPENVEQTLLLVGLSALVFLLLVALTFVLLRNLFKLYAERKLGVLGSRFRTRMVIGGLALSFLPSIAMFGFSYLLMNRSIDKWFSSPVEQIAQDSGHIAKLLSDYAGDNSRQEALEIAELPETQRSFVTGNYLGVLKEFRNHEATLQGGFAVALSNGDDLEASLNLPGTWGDLRRSMPPVSQIEGTPQKWVHANSEFLLSAASSGQGKILVGIPLPRDFSPTLNQIQANQQSFLALSRESKRIRRMYMLLLNLLTVLVLFIASWVSLFLAKLVTKPVAALAEATREISLGHLGHRVGISAADELGELVSSFNRMAAELESSQIKIEQSARALSASNTELEQRRSHIETILENIPTGVLTLDPDKRFSHSNVAFGRIFWPGGGSPAVGAKLREIFPIEIAVDLEHLLRKADRMAVATDQLEMSTARQRLNVAATASSVRHGKQRLGYVIVFEDFSELLKAQKEAAWREVARRVAHEIKNPLTPIALSAERIRRHLDKGAVPDDASLAVIHGCAETIAGAVETVRSLVDEFSSLARFPTAQPRPADVNEIVETALAMFHGRLDGVRVEKQLEERLPQALADPEAIRRALANLIDNAAEATQDCLVREIHISTALAESRDAVEITVADTGHGVTREVKEKLFLPYFSTKQRGTGLGLAIVRRIIEDHRGSIRVEENQPLGTRFVVELPLAQQEEMATPEMKNA